MDSRGCDVQYAIDGHTIYGWQCDYDVRISTSCSVEDGSAATGAGVDSVVANVVEPSLASLVPTDGASLLCLGFFLSR